MSRYRDTRRKEILSEIEDSINKAFRDKKINNFLGI